MSNIVLLSGSSHPAFVDAVADILGVKPAHRVLAKFSSGETKCEIRDSVRGMDVYIVQTFGAGTSATAVASAISNAAASATTNGGEGEDGGVVSVAEKSVYDGYEGEEVNGVGGKGKDAEEAVPQGKPYTVNDYFVELCIMISACKTGSAKRVTAVMPLFPYSRQPDLPFSKIGAPLFGMEHHSEHGSAAGEQASDVKGKGAVDHANESGTDVVNMMGGMTLAKGEMALTAEHQLGAYMYTTHDYENPSLMMALQAKSGHKQFTARAGSLMADLLTCAGVDRVLTCDLHENAYQGFFDIPGMSFSFVTHSLGLDGFYLPLTDPFCKVDNLHARPLLKRYIQQNIPNYHDAVIVSPDAGGAKRATAIADSLSMAFAMIHKGNPPPPPPLTYPTLTNSPQSAALPRSPPTPRPP